MPSTEKTPEELVDAATERGTFSVLAAAKEQNYPTDQVLVFNDTASALQIKRIETRIADEMDPDKVNELDEQIAQLKAKILSSAFVFHLHGIAPGHVRSIFDAAQHHEDDPRYPVIQMIADSITKVTNYEGDKEETGFTYEKVKELYDILPEESWQRLDKAVASLSLASAYFDDITDADFLSKS